MLIVMEGHGFLFNLPEGIIAFLILSAILWCILLFLYYRYSHFRKQVHFELNSPEVKDTVSRKDRELIMQRLAQEQSCVRLMRYNFVLDDYNQIAYKKLNQIRNSISEVPSEIIALIPAARWLFDNFQMLYREIKKVRTSGTSYEVLPILKSKEFRGYPRVYIIAKKMVALSGGHLNYESIASMLRAYQEVMSLTEKEIWVLPEVIGFCLLENIIEVAEDILRIIKVKSKADKIVKEKLWEGKDAGDIAALLCETEPDCRDNYSFHSHVIYLLKNMSFDDAAIQKYVEFHCKSEKQLKPSHVFLEEGKIESYYETVIRSLIISLREINEIDEERFFEEFSCLEHILSEDPDGVYPRMDAESRGVYRGVIVKFALKHKIDEERIVHECLSLAVTGREELNCPHHVGTYLIGAGYKILKARVLGKPIPVSLYKRWNLKGILYFLSFFLILAGFISGIAGFMKASTGVRSIGPYLAILITALPLLMGIALEITNHIFTRGIRVKKIPALDYQKEIPDSARTFIVMPVIVSTKQQGLEYMERLHKHYLANRQPNLYFALLADYADAPEERMPVDAEIEEALISRLNELNELYPSTHQRFSLFIRYRKWNPSEKCYMCWERKRGKLEEFNSLLCGEGEGSFSHIFCDRSILNTFQYVITLDADSDLIRDNAAKLVGLIDHPLNRPVLDQEKKKVTEGYVIIQPSVRNHIPSKNSSRFTRAFGGQCGLDHYSTVISDIYQDIFNQGIYTGKGIYHIQAFHCLLHKTIQDNTVLSHDLLESCYARTAFSSAAKIMDAFPGSVLSYIRREHRWIRGDWQLLPWLFLRKASQGRGICALSKWKIFDNLRRSMVPVSKTLLIVLNLALFPDIFYLWLPLVFFIDILNLIIMLITITGHKIARPKLALLYRGLIGDIGNVLERAFMEFVLTPYRAYEAVDAAVRTLFRVFISKKNLLRWNTAEAVDASIINTKRGYFLSMWRSYIPVFAILGILCVKTVTLEGVILYGIVSFLWATAFYLAYVISRPSEDELEPYNEEDRELLLEIARRTWQFFKQLSIKENNWLCPDNYQMTQTEKITDKTSPTNIGLQFLAILSARDLGFEPLNSTLNRMENLLNTVIQLPKYKGHLYNWYQIKTLEVLNPEYISTVDSGNFLGHLIAVKNGLLEQMDSPIISEQLITQLKRTAELCNPDIHLRNQYSSINEFYEDITDIWDDMAGRRPEPGEDQYWYRELTGTIEVLAEEISGFKLKEYSFANCPSVRQLAGLDNRKAKAVMEKIKELTCKLDCLITNMDFTFLFDEHRLLFHIGYHVNNRMLDAGCYDLMASESSLTSFLAIARGEVPLRHWYRLGRPLTIVKGIPCFVSWSGTMFEYLMPNLVLKEYSGSVFSDTAKAAVLQQIRYAKLVDIPWGISESQYYRFDLNGNYQYKAFGVPKLRLQPVRKNSMVASPYAAMLALEYAGEESFSNLRRLKALGMFGKYGLYEAIDYNGPDTVNLTPYRIVTSFMTHHQGMILASINNYLNHGILRTRFHSEALVKSAEVLLEEKRQSYLISLARSGYTINVGKAYYKEDNYRNRYVNSTEPKIPVACYLSNNKYSVLLTSDGDGFSSYMDMMLYRWRADVYANTGHYIYIKDMSSGRLWSTTYHPTRSEPDEYQAIFSPHQAEFKRTDGEISTQMVVSLSPSHNLEIRKVTLTNHGKETRSFEVTSYLEVVCDSHRAEISHPAFNKLFIESEFLEERSIFLSKRRGSKAEDKVYLMHMVKSGARMKIEYENDRLKFIRRNNTPANPDAVVNSIALSNQAGFCNDPIMSLRVTISLAAGESSCISFITGVCHSREEAKQIGEELDVAYRIDDIFEKFKLQSEIELKYLEISRQQLNAFQDLISPIFYPTGYYRGPEENIMRNLKNQSALWRFGISGDNPIMLLMVKSIDNVGIIKDVLKAYEYLRINRVMVDLAILIEAQQDYLQEVDNLINDMTSSLRIYDAGSERPSFFILHSYEMAPEEIDLLYTVARVVFTERTGIYFRNSKEELSDFIED